MKFYLLNILLFCPWLAFAQLSVAVAPTKTVGQKVAISSTTLGGYAWDSSVWQFNGYHSVFQASLMPPAPSTSEAMGKAVFFIPENIQTERVTVGFGVAVNTENVDWAEGHIFGASTAWAFDLGPATFRDGVTFYSGTTDMVTHQLEDVIAGRTQFEIINRPFYDSLQGDVIAVVPEPSLIMLMAFGIAVLAIAHIYKAKACGSVS